MAGFCGNCGSPITENAKFCPKCGTELPSGPAGAAPSPQKPPPQPTCPRCGAPLPAAAAFCGACGTQLNSAAKPAAGAGAAGREAAEPAKRPRKKKLLSAVAVLLALSLAFTGFISPGFFLTKKEPGSPRATDAWAKTTPRPTSEPARPTSEPASPTSEPVRPTAGPAEPTPGPTPEPARPTPPAEEPEDAEGEEVFGLEDLYQLGTAGIDYALGEGPGSLGYHEMDGYGVETLIAYSPSEIEAAPLLSGTVTKASAAADLGDVTVSLDEIAMGSETVTLLLRTLGRKSDERNGYWAEAWELTLAGQAEYGGSFEIDVPCPRGREMDVIAQKYDPALGRWTYVEYDVDFDASRVAVFSDGPGLIALFGMMRERDVLSARPTANTLLDAGEGALTSLAGGSRELETLTANYSKTLKLNLLPQRFQKAVRGNKDIEYQVSNNYGRIQKQLEEREYAALYDPDSIECFVSDNLGNVLDGSGLACSLVEYYAALPPGLSGPLTMLSLQLTLLETYWDSVIAYYTKGGWVGAAKEVAWKTADVSLGVASLYYLASLAGYVPELAGITPEGLLIVAACILLKNIILDVYENERIAAENAMKPELAHVYRQAPYYNIYWDKTRHELTWFPDADVMFDVFYQISLVENVPSMTGSRVQYIREHMGEEEFKTVYVDFHAYEIPGRASKKIFTDERTVLLDAQFFEVYDSFLAKESELKSNPDNYVSIGVESSTYGPLIAWESGWAMILDHIKETYPEKPEKWFPAFQKYLQQMEELSYEYAYDVSILTGLRMGSPEITPEQMIADVLYRQSGNHCFRKFYEACFRETKKISAENLAKLNKQVNRTITYRLVDQDGRPISFSETNLADKYLVMRTQPELYELSRGDPWALSMKDSEFLRCTYTGYLLAGKPEWIDIYDSSQDYREEKPPVGSIQLKAVGTKQTTVTLMRTVQAEEWLDPWEYYKVDTNSALFEAMGKELPTKLKVTPVGREGDEVLYEIDNTAPFIIDLRDGAVTQWETTFTKKNSQTAETFKITFTAEPASAYLLRAATYYEAADPKKDDPAMFLVSQMFDPAEWKKYFSVKNVSSNSRSQRIMFRIDGISFSD